MKILAVSDVELPQMRDPSYLRRTFSDCRLIISCGDMPADYLELIASALNRPLFFVRGNHDTCYVPHKPGGDNLHLRIQTLEQYSFVGLEGSIHYNHGPIQYTEGQMFTYVLWLLPRLMLMRSVRGYGVDVLVTHSPPRGIHDIPDDFAHRGFRSFRYLMRWARPRYLLHGHVDTWDNRKTRRTVFGQTSVVNVNPFMVLSLS